MTPAPALQAAGEWARVVPPRGAQHMTKVPGASVSRSTERAFSATSSKRTPRRDVRRGIRIYCFWSPQALLRGLCCWCAKAPPGLRRQVTATPFVVLNTSSVQGTSHIAVQDLVVAHAPHRALALTEIEGLPLGYAAEPAALVLMPRRIRVPLTQVRPSPNGPPKPGLTCVVPWKKSARRRQGNARLVSTNVSAAMLGVPAKLRPAPLALEVRATVARAARVVARAIPLPCRRRGRTSSAEAGAWPRC